MLAHVLLGLAAAALLAAVWDAAAVGAAAVPLAVAFGCFLVAQAALFTALRRVEASTVAPLLSVKIVALAALSWGIEGRAPTPLGAGAVLLAVAGAALVAGVGRPPDRRSLGLILLAVAAYAGCDMGIVRAIAQMTGQEADAADRLAAAMRCMGAMYAALGLLAVALLPTVLRRRPAGAASPWPGAAAYAACWAGAMATLFSAFSLLPVVLVAILQSTRSLWSVLLGGWLGRIGLGHLETAHGNGVLAVRLGGATALVLAVGLYAWASAT